MIKEEFFSLVKDLTEYYDKPLRPKALTVWFERLKYFPVNQFRKAVEDILLHERAMPTPSVVIKYAYDAKHEMEAAQKREYKKPDNEEVASPDWAKDWLRATNGIMTCNSNKARLKFKNTFLNEMLLKYPNMDHESKKDILIMLRESEKELKQVEDIQVPVTQVDLSMGVDLECL